MSRKRKKAPPTKVLTLAWSPAMAEVFDLSVRLGMTPPDRVSVTYSRSGRQLTWRAAFRTADGAPSVSVARIRRLAGGDYSHQGETLNFRFVLGGLAGEAVDA